MLNSGDGLSAIIRLKCPNLGILEGGKNHLILIKMSSEASSVHCMLARILYYRACS